MLALIAGQPNCMEANFMFKTRFRGKFWTPLLLKPCCHPVLFFVVFMFPLNALKHNYIHATLQTLETLAQQHQKLIIVGDLNSPDICWSTLHGSTPLFVDLCDLHVAFKFKLEQLFDTPTHIQGNIMDILRKYNVRSSVCR